MYVLWKGWYFSRVNGCSITELPIQKLLLQYNINKNLLTAGYTELHGVKHGINAVLLSDKLTCLRD
jgi:hypothetical protein